MPHRLHLEQSGNIYALPVLHYRMEFAHLVRDAVKMVDPDCIAIELPATLEDPFIRAVQRLPQISFLSYDANPAHVFRQKGGEEQGRTVYLIIEPADPLVEAARLALERGIPLHFIDIDLDEYPMHNEPLPDSYAVQRIGLAAYYREVASACRNIPPDREDLRREKGMAWRLRQLSKQYERVLLVCGIYHLERLLSFLEHPQAEPLGRIRREGVRLCNLHPDSVREVLGEYPFLSSVYEMRRGGLPPEPPVGEGTLRRSFTLFELIRGGKGAGSEEEAMAEAIARSSCHVGVKGEMPDRQRVMFRLFQEEARHYRQETGEPVHHWQRRTFFRYCRNYALLSGQLLPDLYQMLSAARSCIDDNFAYAFWRLATHYSWQRETADIPTLRLSPDELWGASRRIRFRPRPKQREKGLSQLRFLKRKKEGRPGEWLDGFDNPSICSYPPEDLVIEHYGNFLKKKGAYQHSEEEARIEPFTASMLDGIDMRETLRNIHQERIYVREARRIKGGVGSVVVIFDEDRGNQKFPYLMTWLGEHQQESDMAFYATPPEDNVVGPGISRCEYGGFILSFPPRRMFDVWRDRDYADARSKSELLLLAALDYSREKHLVYVAPKPPRSIFRQFAARIGKKILFIPLSSLSPVKLKRLRVFHILYGHDKRETARDYIW